MDDGEKDNQLMASSGWSKQPYTGFGIHIQWYRKDILECAREGKSCETSFPFDGQAYKIVNAHAVK